MAARTSETLSARQEALHLLERGRAELGAEARWLRERVDPRAALKRSVENHPALLVGGGLALGLVATLMFLRRRSQASENRRLPVSRHAAHRPSLGGAVLGQAAHLVVPLVVLPALEKFVKQRLQRSQTS